MMELKFNNTKTEITDTQVWAIISLSKDGLPIVKLLIEDYLNSINVKGNFIFDYIGLQQGGLIADIWSANNLSPITIGISLISEKITISKGERELISYSMSTHNGIMKFIDDNKCYHLLKYLIR